MRKRRKAYSVDAMVRFFLHYYNIPTKQDIEKILKKMDRLEEAVKAAKVTRRKAKVPAPKKAAARTGMAAKGRAKMTATEKVLSTIKGSPKGVDMAKLKAKSGFEDKKIRNIIFRLSKEGTIKRVGRGIYAMR